MQNNSLEMLEFSKVLEIIAGHASFSTSKDLVLNLRPSQNAEVVALRLKQSAEARHLLSLRPNFYIGQVSDIREAVRIAAKGKVLEARTILGVKETLASSRNVRNTLKRLAQEIPALWNIAANIVEMQDIESEIERCINVNAEVMDVASERLGLLRQQLRETRQRLTDKLESMIKSSTRQKFIQEPYITERDSRYVIPVKAEFKKDLRGIVHDISNTGNTVFIEPLETVEMGNDLRQHIIAEKQETERILADLSARIGAREAEICTNMEVLAELDLNLAKARYAEQVRAIEPYLSDNHAGNGTAVTGGRTVLRIVNGRHPLLKGDPVPLNVEIGRDFNILVITGPNAGGKTVALKTMGLLALMTQAGIPVPLSEGSLMPVFKGIFADIGDQQSIEQTLSTFSWHISNIINIMRESNAESLVLLDELGISTDPEEGSALARAILLDFQSRGTMVVATTHYNELKAFAHITPGMQNASLDFDPDTLMPTYKLSMGIPGRSNAISVASRLGLNAGVIERAKTMLRQSSRQIELLLADLLEEKHRYEVRLAELDEDKKRLQNLQAKLKADEARIVEKERKILGEMSDTFAREMASLQRSIREAEAGLKKASKFEHIRQARKIGARIQEEIESKTARARELVNMPKAMVEVKLGDVVRLRERNVEGVLVSIDEKNRTAEIKAGNANVKVGLDEIEGIVTAPRDALKRYPQLKKRRSTFTAMSLELDLRGKRADEVEATLDRFLNDAFLSGLQQVRLIHGYATGALRNVVRELLARHVLVASYAAGGKDEGGDGVTVVKIKL